MDENNKKKVRIRRITKKNKNDIEIESESNEKVKISETSYIKSLQSETLLNDEKLNNDNSNSYNDNSNSYNDNSNLYNDNSNSYNDNSNSYNDNSTSYNDDDNVRIPDKSYNDTLINDTLINNDIQNEDFQHDEEMKLALNISKQDYYDEQDIHITLDISKNDYSKEFEIALDLSKKEYDNKIVEDNLKKESRIKSLESLCLKIKRLCFSESEKKIKIFIEDILNQYFKLDIDFIYIEDNNLYDELYKIIDSYYLIPTQKKYSKTLISKEEDLIFRDIFRKL